MGRWALGVALLSLLGAAQLDLDCARPVASRNLIGQARLSEIEWAEDVNRAAMWEAFGRCPAGPRAEECRNEERRRFEADLDRQRAAIEAQYQRMLEEFEKRCLASITMRDFPYMTDKPDRKSAPARRRHSEPPAPARVLSIHAHPDDQEFTVAGTLAKWARAGSAIVTVCITSGGGGSNQSTPPAMTREALVPIREEEQRSACRILGLATPIFLGYEDGVLEPSIPLRRELTRVIRRLRPDAVVCGDPTMRFYGTSYLNHPDHRAAAEVALDAVFPSAETRLIFPELLDEGLEPHEVQSVYIHGSERPDTFIDISELLELKLAALRAHKTQMGQWDPAEMITQWAREQGKRHGLAAAEAFRRMRLHG